MVKYIVVIGCNNPVNAKLLCNQNGTTKVYSTKDDADQVVIDLIKSYGICYARVVAV